MKIGIISKMAHAKTHARALLDMGHDVVILGSNVTVIPPSFDLIVCREASSSHQAVDVALDLKRSGRIPVIFENGLSGLRREMETLFEAKPAPMDEPTALKLIDDVIQAGGVFAPQLRSLTPNQAVDLLTEAGCIKGRKQRAMAHAAFHKLQEKDYTELRKVVKRLWGGKTNPASGNWYRQATVYQSGTPEYILSAEALTEAQLRTLCRPLGLDLHEDLELAKTAEAKAVEPKEVKVVKEVKKVKAAKEEQAGVTSGPETAARLLLAEMRERGYKEVHLTEKGEVTFIREVRQEVFLHFS